MECKMSSVQPPICYTGAEKYEMLELNRRLESYLNHVKLLEEDNQHLWEEIQAMRRNQDTGGQRKAQEAALSLAREEVLIAWRERDGVELVVSNMLEEIEVLNKLRQREKSAQVEAKRKLEESRKVLEDERRMQMWLKQQAAQLENEVSLQLQIHQDDLVALKSSCAFSKPVLMAPQHSHTLNLQGLGEEYSQRAAQAWREAAGVYQTQMKKLEDSVNQSRDHMTLIKQEKKESQLQVQDLAKELKSEKAKREQLEKNMVQQRQRQNQDLQHLQTHVEALEVEKLDLGEQMGDLLLENRNLLQTKMSLNLEVATYRALLDNESLRVNNQSGSKRNWTVSHLEGITKSPGISPGTQTSSSCLFSSPLHITPRSISHKANLMTSTPTKSLTLRTPQETPKGSRATKEQDDVVRVEKQKLEASATRSKNLEGESSHDHYRAEEEASSTDSVSVPKTPNTVHEPESILAKNVPDEVQEVFKAEVKQVLLSANETPTISSPANGHPQTPESVSPGQNIEEAKSSEDGDEENTELSIEMAQISHAPVSAWEENEMAIPEDRDAVSKRGDITDNCADELQMESDHAESQLLGEKTNTPASLLLQEIPHLSADTVSPFEDDSEILTWADVKEDVIHFVEEESPKSTAALEKEAEQMEATMEVDEAGCPGIEVEGRDFNIKLQAEEHETEPENKGTQSKEKELRSSKFEQEEMEETFVEQKAELTMRTDKNVHLVSENAESEMDTDGKCNQESEKAKTVMNTFGQDQLVESNAEEEQRQSDEDESLNISASWRTDPGEADSYAQDNTLADTRPLLHYKSDEEADANVPIAHQGVSEPCERVTHEAGSHLSQIIAKRFDTMEDLSEEPELGSMEDIDTDGSVPTVLTESMDDEFGDQIVSVDMDSHFETLTGDGLVDQLESELRNNSKENSQGEDETEMENYHLSTFLVEDQDERVQMHVTREIHEQETLLTTSPNINEDAITENGSDNAENVNVESVENPEDESNTPLPEPSQEQAPADELYEEVTFAHEPLVETADSEEHICPNKEDVQSNVSGIIHVDGITDEFTVQSYPDNQTSTTDLDQEEPNSSEDESSNASQCSQLHSQSEDNVTTLDVVANPDPSFTAMVSGELTKESSEDRNAPQAEELENKEEQQHAVDSSSGEMGENADSLPEEGENLCCNVTSASHSIYATAEELGHVETKNKEHWNVFRGVAPKDEEFQTNEKETDGHNFFRSSIKEGIWSATNLAATYEPNDQTETERYSYHSIDPKQTVTFEEDWANLERLTPTNSKPEKDTGTSITQPTEEEEEQEQKMLQTKPVECRDEENVHAGGSTDEGDSWSSGEE